MRKPIVLIAFAIALVAYAATDRAPAVQAQAARRAIALGDMPKLKTVGDPQVSPDGKWVAYTVGTVDVEKDKRETHIWMVSWDGPNASA